MNSAQLINQTSGEVEYYSDPKITAAARKLLGRIDLDPASSPKANETVQAKAWFGFDPVGGFVDGLFPKWEGNVWLNHPFGREESACVQPCERKKKNPKHVCHSIHFHGNRAWINKLVKEFEIRNTVEALCICYACTSEAWFQPLMEYPQCFLSPRTNYYLPDGTLKKGVTKGSVITYLGPDVDGFARIFQPFGKIKVEWNL